MKKNMILWLCTLVLTIVGLSSCSSDDEIEVESYDSTYAVRYYSKDLQKRSISATMWSGQNPICIPPYISISDHAQENFSKI